MIFLVIAALLVNMNSMVYFFEIPYQAVDMGGDQNVISVLNVIHAVIYVISAGVSSGRLRSDRRPMKLLRILILCITSVYTVTCFAQSVNWLYVLVGLHGFLVGLFWSVFWSAFYQKQIKYRMKMSTLTISSAICAVVGPFFAGRVYLLIEKYVLLLFAGLLLIVMLLEKPLNVWMDRSFVKITHYIDERTKRKGEPKKNRSIYQIRQGTGYAQGLGVIVLFWLGILLAGCLEGIFRSAMAVYLLDYHIGSDAWGMLQSVKLLAQTFTLAAIRYAGENRFVFYKTKIKLLFGMGCLMAGTLIMLSTVRVPFMAVGMVLLGIGYGVIYFMCMAAGTNLTGFLGRNLNGIAECLTGAGILAGSVFSGFTKGNPYRVYLRLIVAGTIAAAAFFRKTIWIRAD